jgi:hypothetical protein
MANTLDSIFQADFPDRWGAGKKEDGKKMTRAVLKMNAQFLKLGACSKEEVLPKTRRWAALRMLPAIQLDKYHLKKELASALKSIEEKVEQIQVKTADGETLHGAIVYSDPSNRDLSSKPCLLYFNGNGEFYEYNLGLVDTFAQEMKVNALVFNYRGVGESSGFPTTAKDLVLDGDAFYQWLVSKGLSENKILIHARSLGGLIGTKVRALHPDGPICCDRAPFSWKALEEGRGNKEVGALMELVGWDLDISEDWEKIRGKKMVIYSERDEIINFMMASLFQKTIGSKETEFGSLPFGHNIPFIINQEQWTHFTSFVSQIDSENGSVTGKE